MSRRERKSWYPCPGAKKFVCQNEVHFCRFFPRGARGGRKEQLGRIPRTAFKKIHKFFLFFSADSAISAVKFLYIDFGGANFSVPWTTEQADPAIRWKFFKWSAAEEIGIMRKAPGRRGRSRGLSFHQFALILLYLVPRGKCI